MNTLRAPRASVVVSLALLAVFGIVAGPVDGELQVALAQSSGEQPVALAQVSMTPQVALAQARTARTLGEFLEELKRDGLEVTSPGARARAEAYRASNGLLPEPLLKAVHPKFADLQARVRELSADKGVRGGRLVVPRDKVIWPQPLDFRQAEYAELEFERGYTAVARFPASLASAPVVDMTGIHECTLRGLRIEADQADAMPGCGIFLGRERELDNVSFVRIDNCTVSGAFGDGHKFGGACVVNVGAEVYDFSGNNFRFSGRRGGAYYTGAYNVHHITSPHGAVAGGFNPGGADPISNCGGVIDDSCHFACDELPAGANAYERYIIRIGTRSVSLWIHDIYVTAKTPSSVSAVFVLGDEGDRELYSGVGGIKIENVHDEAFAAEFFCEAGRQYAERDCA